MRSEIARLSLIVAMFGTMCASTMAAAGPAVTQANAGRWIGNWKNASGQTLTISNFDSEILFAGPGAEFEVPGVVRGNLGEVGCVSRKFSSDGSKFRLIFSGCTNTMANNLMFLCELTSDTSFKCSAGSFTMTYTRVP